MWLVELSSRGFPSLLLLGFASFGSIINTILSPSSQFAWLTSSVIIDEISGDCVAAVLLPLDHEEIFHSTEVVVLVLSERKLSSPDAAGDYHEFLHK